MKVAIVKDTLAREGAVLTMPDPTSDTQQQQQKQQQNSEEERP